MGASAVAAVVGTAITAYTVNKSHEAQNTQKRAQLTALKLTKQAFEKTDPAKSNSAAAAAQLRQRQQAAAAQGFGSTILTSPLGIPDAGTTPRKTILGS